MKKYILLILAALAVFFNTATAQTPQNQWEQQLERQVRTAERDATYVAPWHPQVRQQEQAHQKVLNKLWRQGAIEYVLEEVTHQALSPVTQITWQEAMQRATAYTQQLQAKINLAGQIIAGEIGEIGLDAARLSKPTWKTNRPDYGQATKGLKYIYLTDASAHNTVSIVQEVQAVLRAVRKANPQAHILLATEFAYAVMDPLSPPLRFANTPNEVIDIYPEYKGLQQTADELAMDILALDDVVYAKDEQAKKPYWAKVGNVLVEFSLKDIAQVTASYQARGENEKLAAAHNFLQATSWGVQQRNDQWARYIQAVSPYYDIVIVYAGLGHMDFYTSVKAMPRLINQKYAQFDFYAMEQLPEELQQFYQNRDKLVCDKQGVCSFPEGMFSDEMIEMFEQLYYGEVPEWDEKSVLYSAVLSAEFYRRLHQLPPDKQAQLKALEKQYPDLLDGPDSDLYEVYLPDITNK